MPWSSFLLDFQQATRSTGFKLLAFTLAFIVMLLLTAHGFEHRLAKIDPTSLSRMRSFNLAAEGGFGEIFEAGMLLACCAASADVAWRRRSPVFSVLALILAVTLADGLLALHEQFGFTVGPAIGLHSDTAQLLWFLGLGAILMPAALVSYWHSVPDEKVASLLLLAVFMVLGGFAVGVDALQSSLNVPNLIEDGGELIAIASLCLLMLAVRRALLGRRVNAPNGNQR
ncbi:MAG TPA: hypothetical protein VM913_06440 [Sphingomicrobium sp.]|jgi:hypothetical protein|nr:hypothetical protein [Sphingomicrobium sp.]